MSKTKTNTWVDLVNAVREADRRWYAAMGERTVEVTNEHRTTWVAEEVRKIIEGKDG